MCFTILMFLETQENFQKLDNVLEYVLCYISKNFLSRFEDEIVPSIYIIFTKIEKTMAKKSR